MPRAVLDRRNLLCLALGLGLSGCDQASNPVFTNATTVARNLVLGYPDLDISRDTVSRLPYASMAARVGRGPQSLLILSRVEGNDQHWISSDRAVLVTRGGRLVKTYGFPENLRDTETGEGDPVAGRLHDLPSGTTFHRRMVLDKPSRYVLDVDSRFTVLGRRTIRIVGIDFDTVLVREDNSARQVDWSFANYYWVDYLDGYVWQSEQAIARTFPATTYEILKPPG